jgi:ribosome-associated protein
MSESMEPLSKTQLKRDSKAKQSLGKALSELPDELFSRLTLDENLLEALLELRQTRSHEGKRRQLQYVGKLMRQREEAPIQKQLDDIMHHRIVDTRQHHHAEGWRDALLANDPAAVEQLAKLPESERQAIEQCLRHAQGEAKSGQYGRYSRQLFKQLRAGLDQLMP